MSIDVMDFMQHLSFTPKAVLEAGVGRVETARSRPWWGTDVRCDLFEPLPLFYRRLRDATAKYANVRVYPTALWYDENGVYLNCYRQSSYVAGVIPRDPKLKRAEERQVRTQSARLRLYDTGMYDVALIDVENSEWPVLRYMKSRPRFMSLELWRPGKPDWRHPDFDKIQVWLQKRKYRELSRYDRDSYFVRDQKGV